MPRSRQIFLKSGTLVRRYSFLYLRHNVGWRNTGSTPFQQPNGGYQRISLRPVWRLSITCTVYSTDSPLVGDLYQPCIMRQRLVVGHAFLVERSCRSGGRCRPCLLSGAGPRRQGGSGGYACENWLEHYCKAVYVRHIYEHTGSSSKGIWSQRKKTVSNKSTVLPENKPRAKTNRRRLHSVHVALWNGIKDFMKICMVGSQPLQPVGVIRK